MMEYGRNLVGFLSGGCLPAAAAVLLALSGGVLPTGPAAAGEQVEVDGLLHIRNDATPSEGRTTVELEELWRIGGADSEEIFGLISQVETDEDGNVYLLDSQLSEVKVYSPDGEYLKTLSREGEGPGEVRQPNDMVLLPDGTLGLAQTFPGKIVKIDLEGNPAGSLTLGGADPTQGGFVVLLDASSRAGNLVLAGVKIGQSDQPGVQLRTNFLSRYSLDGEELVTYLEKPATLDFTDLVIDEEEQYFVFPRRWSIGPDGRVFAAAQRDAYAIHVYREEGALDRVIEREFTPRKRTAEELERINAVIEVQTAQLPGEARSSVGETEVAIVGMRVARDGSLWVVSSRGNFEQPEGVMLTYDVFDPEGHFKRQISMACEGDGAEDWLLFPGEDRAFLIKGLIDAAVAMQGAGAGGDEDAMPMEVVCYKVPEI
ncbi:MAG: hypothetical protein GF355_14185 [Candidatus Eisenbacteria bacterium]|nr:hypothetical protein [Candidatus Eisenbacteria bacterium]